MCHIQEGEGEEDRNNNSLVLSPYSDKFLSRQGASAQAGARSDDKPLPHCTAVLAIYDQASYKMPAGPQFILGWCCYTWVLVTSSNEAALLCAVCSYCALNSDRHFRTSSSCYWRTLSALAGSSPLCAVSWPHGVGEFGSYQVSGLHHLLQHFSKYINEIVTQIYQSG